MLKRGYNIIRSRKIYKSSAFSINRMFPSDPRGSLDEFCFFKNIQLTKQDFEEAKFEKC